MNHPQHHHRPRATSEVLEETLDNHQQQDEITLGELVHALHERGFGLLMVIFVLPNCVPIPVPPGVSTVFSLPLLFLSLQMLIGRDYPWLPAWLKKKTIKRATLALLISKLSPKLKFIEKLLKPRLSFASSTAGERIVGFFWLLFAISIAIPLPMTNFIPGVGILIMSLGLLSKDGITIITGIVIGMLGIFLTTAVILLGAKVVHNFLNTFSPVEITE